MNRVSSIGLADMMAALMMTFMFISVAFLAQLENSNITFVEKLNAALKSEFKTDLPRWKADITDENVFRFRSPFTMGGTNISPEFEAILNEFCPRYIALLSSEEFISGIAEVKVEGHTSQGWNSFTSPEQSFIENIKLSQQRATNVLSYCYLLNNENIISNRQWLEEFFHANGLASSKPIIIDGEESPALSRRVDFMVVPKLFNIQ